jgi:ribonuclease J
MQFHSNNPQIEPLRILSLGGFGKVTSNMFVYEYAQDILLVDCGMGFPSEDMLGIDILIPDIAYLKHKLDKIRGLVITHGHEDHTGALPYILPQIGNVPVYASKLTANLIMEKLADYKNMPKQINVLNPGMPLQLGKFTVESVRISHSIPDATNLIIKTPVGNIFHASDFKFDFTPVDGVQPDVGRIAQAGNEGVLLLLSDSLGSERRGMTPSEKTLGDMFEREITNCAGKFIVTTMSSNISRWRQAAETAIRHGRRIAISGRSIERNIDVATRLGYLNLPKEAFVELKEVKKLPPKNVCVLVAGSQAQSGSALERIALQDHKDISIVAGDKVVFSSDYIPGNESAVQNLIDILSQLGANCVYSGITDNLHVSGHGSQQDLLLMLALTRPKFALPIGGTYRHMVQYSHLAQSMGYAQGQVLLPNHGQTIEATAGQVKFGHDIEVRTVMVDGLGVGDVGNVVLRDRKLLAEEGLLAVVTEVDQNDFSKIINLDLISRGFVFAPGNTDLLSNASAEVRKVFATKQGKIESDRHAKQIIIDTLERFIFDQTHRRPMILPVIVDV